MFEYIRKIVRYLKIQNGAAPNREEPTPDDGPQISESLQENLDRIRQIFGASEDVVIREFSFGYGHQTRGALVFIEGLIDMPLVNDNIIKPLMYGGNFALRKNTATVLSIKVIKSMMLPAADIRDAYEIKDAVNGCLAGDAALFVNGFKQALVVNCKGFEKRNVEDPQSESVIRGPREGFTKNLRTNTTLLRRKIRNPDLIMETMKIGKRTATGVCIAYLRGVASPELVEEIKRRLNNINTDAILESGYIEQYIEDSPLSVFATIGYSEKPDAIAGKILEGRVAVLVDGTPFVLTAPMLFVENFQTSEDYYVRMYFANVMRMLRFLAYAISVLAPAVYVALTTFHQELLPTALLFTMIAAREGVPFPAVMEAGIMMATFEIIREAGVRLPRPVGQAVSIVGALVIGESAVSAGLIGAPMVIVVAITAISSFVVPNHIENGTILRMIFLVLSGVMGGFGIVMGLLGVMIHLSSLQSFGTPYLSPVAPAIPNDMKDTFIRAPLWMMLKRPYGIARRDVKRQKTMQIPPNAGQNEQK